MKPSKLSSFLLLCFFPSESVAFQASLAQSYRASQKYPAKPLTSTRAAAADAGTADTSHTLSIEYCTGCRWMLKSFWMAQELLTTFEQDLEAVTILPSSNKGIFAVRLNGNHLLWDRKEQGGFPSPKGLKQLVRDMVEPEKFLGHSDTEERQIAKQGQDIAPVPETPEEFFLVNEDTVPAIPDCPQPSVTITYCTGCRWLLRAAYFGQELLTTFDDEIKSVTLVPSKPPAKGGVFVSPQIDALQLSLCPLIAAAPLTFLRHG
jgi:selenoprotein W-related protein